MYRISFSGIQGLLLGERMRGLGRVREGGPSAMGIAGLEFFSSPRVAAPGDTGGDPVAWRPNPPAALLLPPLPPASTLRWWRAPPVPKVPGGLGSSRGAGGRLVCLG